MPSAVNEAFADQSVSPSDEITALMRHRILRYLDSRSDPDIYQSLRNMSEFVSDDYGSRFLIELIQNAHDAHDSKRCDGEIAIVLDPDDGPHGCLYVANRGAGFIWDNVKSISNIALSSKPVNAGIGNKGIGFRSVLQICTWPEIFSAHGVADTGRFDGYCFRFATEDDLRELVGAHPSPALDARDMAREMAENMPCWHIPLPADLRPDVARFAAAGFATVVRLPLKSDDALSLVRTEIDHLLQLQTPLHLFLNRVGCISISRDGLGETRLERKVLQTWSILPRGWKADTPIEYRRVQLGSEAFLLADWNIDEELFRKTLESSLAKKEIPEAWRKWEGAACVSVAVPLGRSIDLGRLYCFLPLGPEGRAPFAGYINANFYTKMDRRTVNDAIGLNSFFLRMAAWVSCQAVGFLIEQNWAESPAAAVSLLCWDDAYLAQLRHGLGDDGKGILMRALLPVRGLGNTVAWAPAERTVGWTAAPDAWLSTQSLCEVAGVSVLLDALTVTQRNALDHLYQRLRGTGFAPTPAMIADWVEKIAIRAHADGVPALQWGAFYDEIAHALADHPQVLFGKRFLLSVNGDLIRSDPPTATPRGRRAADVYFAPVMAVDADADDSESKRALPLEEMPARLRSGFALLSRDVPWSIDGGQRPGRLFLVSGKLARDYDTRDVIRTLAAVTRSEVADSTRQQALEWSFRLLNSARSLSEKETKGAQFFLPCVGGWQLAESAMFGGGWSVDNGKRLETFLGHAEAHSKDLEQVRTRLLPAFEDWPIRNGAETAWIHFLTAAGVTDCLRPIGGEKLAPEQSGTPHALAWSISRSVSGMDETLCVSWRDQMLQAAAHLYSSRNYRSELAAWRLPGQHEATRFSAELRRDYAVQIARSIRALNSDHLEFRVMRAGVGAVSSEVRRWPTPLHAFLTRGAWLPIVRQGSALNFVAPGQAWFFQEDEERPPRFMDLMASQVALTLDATTLQWLCEHASLSVFNNDKYAGRAIAAMATAAAHGISDLREVRRFTDLFRRLWMRAQTLGQVPAPSTCVPVRHGGSITAVHKTGGAITSAYLDDQHDVLRTQLLEEVGEAVFDFVPGDAAGVWEWVLATAPGRFKQISTEALEVFLDGVKFDEAARWPLLTEVVGPWIIDFLLCVAEHKGGSFVKATQNSLGRLRRTAMSLGIAFAENIQIAHGERRLALPGLLRGALVLPTPQGSVLAVQASRSDMSLESLASIAGHLAAALSMREMAHGLEAALLRLARLQGDAPDEPPGDDTVASALGIEPGSIKRTRELASGDLRSLLHFALPLAACLSTPQVLDTLVHLVDDQDPPHDTLHAALETLATNIGMPLATFEHRMISVNDMRDLMVEFGLPIAKMNAAMEQLGGVYKPVSNEAQHRDEWSRYLRLHMTAIVEQLRQRIAGRFDRGESLEAYAKAREAVLSIAPDVAWFRRYDELPEPVMVGQIDQWIAEQLPSDPSQSPLDLSIAECRTTNSGRLRDFWERFGPVLSAWVRARTSGVSADLRQAWLDPMLTREVEAARARDHGWLDFRTLDDATIAKWLTMDGIWPSGQPVVADPLAWGLTPDAVLTSAQRAQREREEQQRRRSDVSFAGQAYSGHKEAYADIAAAVAGTIANAPALSKVTPTEAALNDMVPPSGGAPGSGSGGGGTRTPPENPMSEVQKKAVGLLGELWAREWIRRRHGLDAVDESMWVSGYRDTVLGVSGGLDTLGYDFIVATKSRTYYYEVKASTGDPRRFEIGPTEIITAQRYRSDREHRYRILYVSNVDDPERARISMLFNPFSMRGEAKFRMVGKGSVIYEFDPA
ncbi:sacsin N-terminal ATP-binding-like domain-containing protein [Paraburkholderia aspalathi]|uniref:Protein NO VEIN C-terminal domain-containing protein n=1 Tax=Paraburkholderia aspalathi TaxID=1324617 RepID=A0A1I7AA89_9BURK|nr:DUF3883 domain-containing protein [Paraburkholderia aspalathi]SFT71839.1 protein of unknown function [Paraburkholderia aspalathi]